MEERESTALEAYIARRTLPLLTDQTSDGKTALLGTSTLLEVASKLFLVTAAHVFEDVNLTGVAVPEGAIRSDVWTLGGLNRLRPYDSHFDVEVLEIRDAETEARLRRGWDCITLDAFGSPSRSGRFVLSGFPSELTKPTTDLLSGTLLSVYTVRLPDFPSDADQPCHPGDDLFFLCDDSHETSNEPLSAMPKLQGTSGASVWEVCELQAGTVWSPELVLSVVGVQSSYRRGKYFRAKGWHLVLETLAESEDPNVQKAASEVLARL